MLVSMYIIQANALDFINNTYTGNCANYAFMYTTNNTLKENIT